jgi:hypothetical protein
MSEMGQSRRFYDVRDMSVHPPIAAVWQTSQHFAFVPILLQKWPTMPAVVAILDVVPALCNRSLRGERR